MARSDTRHRGSIRGSEGSSAEAGGTLRRLGRLLRCVHTRHTSHVTRHMSHVTRHTSHVTRHTSYFSCCSEDRVSWEVKRYRLEGTTLLEFSTFNTDEISREISLEGVLLFKNVGAKVGLSAAAPCICLESLGLSQSNARVQLKKVRG